MSHKKIIAFDAAPAVFAKLKDKGKKIVQCHGTFDLLHPGHIYHLEEARALGDALVVTVNIGDDVSAVKRHGGEVHYIGSVVFSSTKLINNYFENLATPVKNFCRALAKTCSPEQFRDSVESLAG